MLCEKGFEAMRATEPRWAAAMVGLFAASLALSAVGIDWGLPNHWNPDELYRANDLFFAGRRARNYHYGSHHKVLLHAALLPCVWAAQRAEPRPLPELFEDPQFARTSGLVCRWVGAVESALGVVLVFAMVGRAFGLGPALAAGMAGACLPVRVVTSPYAGIDSPLFLWAMASIYALFRAVCDRHLGWYAAAAVLAGLAATTKPTGGLLVLLVVWAAPFIWRNLALRRCLLGAALFAGGAPLGTPQMVTDASVFWRHNLMNPISASSCAHGNGLILTSSAWAVGLGGPVGALALVVGGVRSLRSSAPRVSSLAKITGAWFLLGYGFFLLCPTGDIRNSLAFVTPITGVAVASLVAAGGTVAGRRWLAGLAIGLAMASSVVSLDAFVNDPRAQAERWLATQRITGTVVEEYRVAHVRVPAGATLRLIGTPERCGFVHPSQTRWAPVFEWFHRNVKHDYDRWMEQFHRDVASAQQVGAAVARELSGEALQRRAPDWVVVCSDDAWNLRSVTLPFPAGADYLDALAAGKLGYEKRASFGPRWPRLAPWTFLPAGDLRVWILAPGPKSSHSGSARQGRA